MMRSAALLAILFALTACSGDSTTPDGDDFGFTAKIDGVPWTPDQPVTAINAAPGLYSITAYRFAGANNYTTVFALYNITGPGNYALGVGPNVFGGTANLSRPPSSGWSTPLNGVAGEFNITTLTATRMVATFRFDTTPIISGSSGNPKVTEGSIDIPVSGSGGVALANQGSKLTGTIGGAFSAAVVAGNLSNAGGSNPILTVTASNGERNITISIANMTGAGAYPLSATSPVRTIGVSGAPGNLTATWVSQGAGGSGSVNISSVTASRILGSFTGTLVPLAGGATGNLSVSGNFEVARLF